jgi:phage terminase Nu1 subunit (DNA packaging protein)
MLPFWREGASNDEIRRWMPSLTDEEIAVLKNYIRDHLNEVLKAEREIKAYHDQNACRAAGVGPLDRSSFARGTQGYASQQTRTQNHIDISEIDNETVDSGTALPLLRFRGRGRISANLLDRAVALYHTRDARKDSKGDEPRGSRGDIRLLAGLPLFGAGLD